MLVLILLASLYFLPTLIAAHRGHGIGVLLLLNLFFGWTIIGWFALLLWACLLQPVYCIPLPPPYGYTRRW